MMLGKYIDINFRVFVLEREFRENYCIDHITYYPVIRGVDLKAYGNILPI